MTVAADESKMLSDLQVRFVGNRRRIGIFCGFYSDIFCKQIAFISEEKTWNCSTPLASTNLIAGRTLEQFGGKAIRSAKILHIRVGFSFIVLPRPGSCTAGARYTRRKEVTL